MNQIVEIALRFFIHDPLNPSVWPEILPKIQSLLNNTFFSTTGKTFNEIVYGFSTRRPLDLLAVILTPDIASQLDAVDAIAFTTTNQKEYYNRRHQLFL